MNKTDEFRDADTTPSTLHMCASALDDIYAKWDMLIDLNLTNELRTKRENECYDETHQNGSERISFGHEIIFTTVIPQKRIYLQYEQRIHAYVLAHAYAPIY